MQITICRGNQVQTTCAYREVEGNNQAKRGAISKIDRQDIWKFSLYYTVGTASQSTQEEQSPPVFYLLFHPTQLAVSLASSVSGNAGVDLVLCSQQSEP
jgi:hypothetical protein